MRGCGLKQEAFHQLLVFVLALLIAKPLAFAEGTSGGFGPAPQSFGNQLSSQELAYQRQQEEIRVAGIPVLVGILVGAGIRIAAKQIAKQFTKQTANAIRKNFLKGVNGQTFKQLKNSACFSVRGDKGNRLILGPDKKTALFTGNHDAYERYLKSAAYKAACGKKTGVASMDIFSPATI